MDTRRHAIASASPRQRRRLWQEGSAPQPPFSPFPSLSCPHPFLLPFLPTAAVLARTCSLICLLSIEIMRAPNSTPVVCATGGREKRAREASKQTHGQTAVQRSDNRERRGKPDAAASEQQASGENNTVRSQYCGGAECGWQARVHQPWNRWPGHYPDSQPSRGSANAPIVRSCTGWKRLSVNCSSRHDLPTPARERESTE
eukprot:SAG22_NODE_116_length_19306_cov_247.696517_5_plen_201_part_00